MRKRAWDYGRLALVNKDYEKYVNGFMLTKCICTVFYMIIYRSKIL